MMPGGRRGVPRAAGLWLLLSGLVFLGGCGPRPPRQRSTPEPAGPSTARKERRPEMPGQVNTQGITIFWREKGLRGRLKRIMDVRAETGTVDAETQSGTLHRAAGLFYRDDKPRARYEAPVVEAAKDRSIVVARGGVTMRSVDPPGVTLTADRVTWHVARNTIVAEGGVHVVYQPPGAPRPTAVGNAPRLTINTELQSFHIP